MPHHRRHGHNHHHHSPIPPIPPIPPVPPIDFGEGGSVGHEFRKLFGIGHDHGFRGSWGPFHFDFSDDERRGNHGRGGGGRRGKRMFESGELRLVLLKLIADTPRHGYDCIRAIEEMTGGEYAPSPGIVYPTLTMLDEMGLIAEKKSKDAKKVFEATDEGRAHLEERSEEIDTLIERLEDMKPEPSRNPGPAIGRAVKNLMTALGHRVGRDGLDDDLLHEIAAILDEAAQKIERAK